jgi:hypothetical protein
MAAPALSVKVIANLTELREQLQKGLDPILATTRTHLRQMSNAFDGASIMSRATAAIQAVGQLGGVAKLTADEQRKLNGILDDAIQKYHALGKQAPPEMLALEQATRKASDAGGGLSGKLDALVSDATQQAVAFGAGLLSVQALGAGFSHLETFVQDCVTSFLDAETADRRMVGALRAAGIPQFANDYRDLADEVQRVSTNSDGAARAAIAAFTSIGHVGPDQMRPVIQAAMDLAAGMGIDLPQAADTLARAIDGQVKSLRAYGIQIDDTGDKGKRLKEILDGVQQNFGGQAQAELETTTGKLKQLGNAWDAVKGSIGQAIATSPYVVTALGLINRALEQQEADAKKAQDAYNQYLADAMNRGLSIPKASNFGQLVNLPLPEVTADTKAAEQAARDHQAAVKAEADEIIRLNAALIDEIMRMDAMVTRSFVTTQALEKFTASMIQMRQQLTLPQYGDAISTAEHGLSVLMKKNSSADALTNAIKFMPRVSLPKPPKMSADDLGAGLGNALSLAIQGGGDVARAGGAFLGGELGKHLSDEFGDTLKNTLGKVVGGALNTVLPGIGTLLGSLAGKAIKGLGKLFGFGTAGRDLVQSFADSMGGFDALHDKLDQLGASGEQLWKTLTQGVGSNNAKQAQAAIDQVKGALDELNQKQLDVQDKFAALLDAVGEFGGRAPAELQPMVEQLLQMKGLTDEQRQLLTDMLGDPSMQAAQDAADLLGVKFEHMGQTFKDAQIDKTAFQYQHALDTLRDSGSDMNGVLMDSKDKINDLVDQAIQAGTALPETMKPYIEKLIEMGQLVAPDGTLITNIDQISFADIPDDSLDAIKTILQQIRDILKDDIPEAAGYAQSALDAIHMPEDVSPGPTYAFVGGQWVNYGSAEAADNVRKSQNRNAQMGSSGGAAVPMASGGYVHVDQPTLFLAGEAGPEDAIFSGGGRSLAGVGANVSIVVNPSRGMNERQLAAEVAKRIPMELRRAGY